MWVQKNLGPKNFFKLNSQKFLQYLQNMFLFDNDLCFWKLSDGTYHFCQIVIIENNKTLGFYLFRQILLIRIISKLVRFWPSRKFWEKKYSNRYFFHKNWYICKTHWLIRLYMQKVKKILFFLLLILCVPNLAPFHFQLYIIAHFHRNFLVKKSSYNTFQSLQVWLLGGTPRKIKIKINQKRPYTLLWKVIKLKKNSIKQN